MMFSSCWRRGSVRLLAPSSASIAFNLNRFNQYSLVRRESRAVWTTALNIGAVGAAAAGCLVFSARYVPALLGIGAPFVPTAREKEIALFGENGLLRETSRDSWLPMETRAQDLTFVDLGCGDGSMLRAARHAGFKRAIGFEINPFLAGYSALRAGPNECIRWQSLWQAELQSVDVVLIYANQPVMDALGAKLRAELPEGAIVVSNAYQLPRQWLGLPKAVHFTETFCAAWTAGLRDTSSHLYCYQQTTESHSAISWQQDARKRLYHELIASKTRGRRG